MVNVINSKIPDDTPSLPLSPETVINNRHLAGVIDAVDKILFYLELFEGYSKEKEDIMKKMETPSSLYPFHQKRLSLIETHLTDIGVLRLAYEEQLLKAVYAIDIKLVESDYLMKIKLAFGEKIKKYIEAFKSSESDLSKKTVSLLEQVLDR